MNLGLLRGVVGVICVAGIAGMIIGSVAGNNNGVVITFGLIAAVSVLVLMAVSAALRSPEGASPAPDEALAAGVEDRIQALVAAGADEAALRDLVGQAVRLGRSTR